MLIVRFFRHDPVTLLNALSEMTIPPDVDTGGFSTWRSIVGRAARFGLLDAGKLLQALEQLIPGRHCLEGSAKVADIARDLDGRKSGAGLVARCPGHKDKNPSLSLVKKAGRVLVHCHADAINTQ